MVRQESGVNTCIASSEKTDETLFRQICTGMRPTEHDTACSGVRTSMASVPAIQTFLVNKQLQTLQNTITL